MTRTIPNIAIALAMMPLAFTPALAKREPARTWTVTRIADPVTGSSRCVVAAMDRIAGSSFSRTGALYPVIETSAEYGLLVGVSSGGRIRLPTGDMLWRVDDYPHRTLRAADNPLPTTSVPIPAMPPDATTAAMRDTMAFAAKLAASATATSTLASGEQARAMLDEMLAGHALVYRAVVAASDFGLPSSATYRVGQFTKDGLRPIPIDDSFREGIAACGIGATGK